MKKWESESELNEKLLQKINQPLSVLEMKRVKEGKVKGIGKVVGIGDQYFAVCSISIICSSMVRCSCDASDNTHYRQCGYQEHIDFTVDGDRPPTPVVLSVFDTGSGKPQLCPRCKGSDIEVKLDHRRARLIRLQESRRAVECDDDFRKQNNTNVADSKVNRNDLQRLSHRSHRSHEKHEKIRLLYQYDVKDCEYKHPNPSKITEHKEEIHDLH